MVFFAVPVLTAVLVVLAFVAVRFTAATPLAVIPAASSNASSMLHRIFLGVYAPVYPAEVIVRFLQFRHTLLVIAPP